ncbi:MAG: hypothetical protein PHF46_00640 [Candidatus Gracilibacteria bacterium]|nr:hypothetical protein [Candidatus Gracilibacteria bacterium]MDD3119903.1 hypothetical protein [Candidatus Gracilibacteria bacterium]MDD4530074.1 hypothetical protein [Candidatus Gracilibacteria bacterium]
MSNFEYQSNKIDNNTQEQIKSIDLLSVCNYGEKYKNNSTLISGVRNIFEGYKLR